MITTFFRSSSFNAWDFCSHQYYCRYVLGFADKANLKAIKGSIVHKALEILAHRKLAEQNGQAVVHEEETGLIKPRHLITPEVALLAAWDLYTRKEDHLDWKPKDKKDCQKWLTQGMEFQDGLYNPLKRKIVVPEQYFSFTIDEPWASYDFQLPDGTRLKGQLGLKGTMDLITSHPICVDDSVIEYLDWKTGQIKDWAKGKEKDFFSLCDDPQLRIYHYALSRLYPNAKEIFITIFFVQFLKPFSICFTRDDLKKTELMLRKRFELIKATTNPPWIRDNPAHNWKCKRLCEYGRSSFPNDKKTICERVKSDLLFLGMDKVNAKYMDVRKLTSYGAGGGVSDRK